MHAYALPTCARHTSDKPRSSSAFGRVSITNAHTHARTRVLVFTCARVLSMRDIISRTDRSRFHASQLPYNKRCSKACRKKKKGRRRESIIVACENANPATRETPSSFCASYVQTIVSPSSPTSPESQLTIYLPGNVAVRERRISGPISAFNCAIGRVIATISSTSCYFTCHACCSNWGLRRTPCYWSLITRELPLLIPRYFPRGNVDTG